MVHLEFWKTASDRTCIRMFGVYFFSVAVWGVMKQNLLDENLAVSLSAQRNFEDLKMRHVATNFCTFIGEIPWKPAAFWESFQVGVGHYSGKRNWKKENEHDWPRRPWCPRGASQHVVTPNLSSCQTKVQTFITVSWPWLSLPQGFYYIKDKSKTPYFISSLPHASSVDFTTFFSFNSTPPHRAALLPITVSLEQQRCLNQLQSKGNYRAVSKNRERKEKKAHLTWFWRRFVSDGHSFKESPFSINCLQELNIATRMCMRRRLSTTHPLRRNWHKWIPRECANEEEEKAKEAAHRVVDKVVGSRCGEPL